MNQYPHPFDDPIDDPELRDVAGLVHDVLHDHRMRPAARDALRARLMAAAVELQSSAKDHVVRPEPGLWPGASDDPARDEAWADDGWDPAPAHPAEPATPATSPLSLAGKRTPKIGGLHRVGGTDRPPRPAATTRPPAGSPGRRGTARRMPKLGWSAMGAAAGLAAVLIVLRGLSGAQTPPIGVQRVAVNAVTGVVDRISADPGEGLTMTFSQPLNPDSVAQALRLDPATTVTTSWQGNTMTVSPVHGFAPNAAYVLTIDHAIARTSSGSGLASDVQVTFGTAPMAEAGDNAPTPVQLPRTELAAAKTGSEAVVVGNGAVLLTAARDVPGSPGMNGLVRVSGTTAARLAAPAAAICVSRSGKSVAYLSGSGADAKITLADSSGTARSQVGVNADPATPLGWIGDDEITFVSHGKLRAVDRQGKTRTLLDSRIDAGHDTVVLAPGGRYIYLAHGQGRGALIDLVTHKSHTLVAVQGAPTFSADGGTVFWVESHGGKQHLNRAPSGGGPTLSVRLPDLQSGDTISNLSVSPDSSLIVYSVTHTDQRAQLRLASLPTATTLAVSTDGAGQSPNWSPSGRMFTVLGDNGGRTRIQTVPVPKGAGNPATNNPAVIEAVAQAFANAQISGATGAQQAIASGVDLPTTPRVTRASVLWARTTGSRTATAVVRLSIDPTTADPVTRQAVETLKFTVPSGGGIPKVTSISLGTFAAAPAGPQLTHVDPRSAPGSVLLTFDSDLDPRSVPSAVAMLSATGTDVAVTATYDAGTRTITAQPAVPDKPGTVTVVVTTALKDVAGTSAADQLTIPVHLTGQ